MVSIDDRDLARQYSEKAGRTRGLAAAAIAALQLDYASMLLGSQPVDALAVINDVRRSAPPEPLAGYGESASWKMLCCSFRLD